MTVTDTRAKVGTTTTLNDVLVGQVFTGTVIGRTGLRYTGAFLKVEGRNVITSRDNPNTVVRQADVVVVQLTGDKHGRSGLILTCRPVEDYQPRDAELILR